MMDHVHMQTRLHWKTAGPEIGHSDIVKAGILSHTQTLGPVQTWLAFGCFSAQRAVPQFILRF